MTRGDNRRQLTPQEAEEEDRAYIEGRQTANREQHRAFLPSPRLLSEGERSTNGWPFDLNAGVLRRRLPGTDGTNVVMYIAEPGVYYLDSGTSATDEQATAAGYDIILDRVEMRRNQRIAEAVAKVQHLHDEEIARVKAEAAAAADEETKVPGIVVTPLAPEHDPWAAHSKKILGA